MEQRYLTVSAVNQYLKAKLDQDIHLQKIYIQGEISNLKFHRSGHYYFTLKDEKSRINAVMFSSYASKLNVRLEDGMKVLVIGSLSVYVAGGNFQLYVYHVALDGIGQLHIQFEQLKKKLYQEGLFAKEFKKSLPAMPKTVGVITGYPSAALEDILRTISQKNPLVKIKIFPTLVQGENAYIKIIERIKQADSMDLDVLILARGGGSLEDLWNFNQEALVRAVFACETPIITGVGHEIDTTLVDYVSDYRAATPTAAANIAVPDINELLMINDQKADYLQTLITHRMTQMHQRLEYYRTHPRLNDPQLLVSDFKNQLVHHDTLLVEKTSALIKQYHYQQNQTYQRFINTYQLKIRQWQNNIIQNQQQMYHFTKDHFVQEKHQFLNLVKQLNLLNPLSILERGYTVVSQEDHIIKSVNDVKKGQEIDIRFSDGSVKAKIK